jgi:hypothetical protein
MMACRSEMPGKTAVHDCQYRTAMTGLQCKSAKTGLPGHMTSGIEEPEQILL